MAAAAFILATAGETQRGPVEQAERNSGRGPLRCAQLLRTVRSPQASSGARAPAATPSLPGQRALRPSTRRLPALRTAALPIASLLRPPATQVRRHRPFDSWPLLRVSGLFRGRYLDAERLRCNSLVVTSAQVSPRSGSGERGSSGAEVPKWEGI